MADGCIDAHGDRRLHACSFVLADRNEQRLERCDNVTMVCMSKLFASHLVMLEGEDGLMATPPGFERSHTCKGLLPCCVSIHNGWRQVTDGRLKEPLGVSDSDAPQGDHDIKVTYPGGMALVWGEPKQCARRGNLHDSGR